MFLPLQRQPNGITIYDDLPHYLLKKAPLSMDKGMFSISALEMTGGASTVRGSGIPLAPAARIVLGSSVGGKVRGA